MVWTLKENEELDFLWFLDNEEPRSVGVVLFSILEDRLKRAIDSKLVIDSQAYGDLFENGGGLNSFGARIRLGLLLGLYEKDIFQEINRLCKIRNQFAHSLTAVDFEVNEIKVHIAQLKYSDINAHGSLYLRMGRPVHDDIYCVVTNPPNVAHKENANRQKYIKSIEIMTQYLFVVGTKDKAIQTQKVLEETD